MTINSKFNLSIEKFEDYCSGQLYDVDPVIKCPNSMVIDVFKTEKFYDDKLVNEALLERNCEKLEKIYLNMYPGGSGMQVIFIT